MTVPDTSSGWYQAGGSAYPESPAAVGEASDSVASESLAAAAGENQEPEPDYRCPTCGVEILSSSDRAEHLAGLDADRIECGRQDVGAIAERDRLDRTWPHAITSEYLW